MQNVRANQFEPQPCPVLYNSQLETWGVYQPKQGLFERDKRRINKDIVWYVYVYTSKATKIYFNQEE